MRPRRRRDQGMSMLEVMIVLGVLMILAAALYMILFRSTREYSDASRIGTISENGRRVLDSIANELRQANKSTVVIGSNSIQFNMLTGFSSSAPVFDANAVTYQLQTSPVDANNNGNKTDDWKLVRVYTGVTKTECDYVKAAGLTFTRSTDTVLIKLTLNVADEKNKMQERSVETSVTLRNEP